MEIPSKIYIERSTANILSHQDDTLASIWSKPSSHNDLEQTIEYTNLSEKWHDVSNSAPISKEISVENPIVIYSKGFSMICDNSLQYARVIDFTIAYGIENAQWAWLKRLLP